MTVKLSLVILFTAALASCSDRGKDMTATRIDPKAGAPEGVEPAAMENEIEIPVVGEATAPVLLGTGGAISYTATIPAKGSVRQVGIQIGNFSGSSDGALELQVCKGDQCSSGLRSLAGSLDNSYFDVGVDNGLNVQKGDLISIRLEKKGGSKDLALWMYGSDVSSVLPDGTKTSATPKTRVGV